jgi:aspartate aminotransferase
MSNTMTDVTAEKTAARVSTMAQSMQGSEILKVGAEIRALVAEGKQVCNLSVGDFSPSEFRVPRLLETATIDALAQGETNYPAADGMPSLRQAVQAFFERWLGLKYSLGSVLITSGSRPGIYATYRAIVDPGDVVVFPVPSWNNNHYCHFTGAQERRVSCSKADNFLPTRGTLEKAIRGARLLVLNSPSNPTGTMFAEDSLAEICDMVLEENERRSADERSLYVLYDQVYWMLTFGGATHVTPVGLRPDMAPYTVYVDGVSKSFAATGMRVGWAVGPEDIIERMSSILAHVGAWAPRAEQLATAKLLAATDEITAFQKSTAAGLEQRLSVLYRGLQKLREEGLPVDCTTPVGTIYLSAQFALQGKRTRDGQTLRTNDDIRRYILREASLAAIPFQAFGVVEDSGWFRLSIGAVSVQSINDMLPKLREALQKLS